MLKRLLEVLIIAILVVFIPYCTSLGLRYIDTTFRKVPYFLQWLVGVGVDLLIFTACIWLRELFLYIKNGR